MSSSITLAFKFANHDNSMSPVQLTVPESMLVKDLRSSLLENWPPTLQTPPSHYSVCLISMGRPMDESLSLKANKVPKYDWPTPVHVAIKGGAGLKATSAAGSGGGTGGAASGASSATRSPPPAEDASCACVIS
jgi:hypothetical protein